MDSGLYERVRRGCAAPAVTRALIWTILPLGLVACSENSADDEGDDAEKIRVEVKIQNVGTAPGIVTVEFSEGDVELPCPDVLGPGESCAPFVEDVVPADTVFLEASTDVGVGFTGWGGACGFAGQDPECVLVRGTEPNTVFDVLVEFDPLAAGG